MKLYAEILFPFTIITMFFSKQHNKHSTSLVIKQRCGFEYVGTESAATLALSTLWCVELYDFILCL